MLSGVDAPKVHSQRPEAWQGRSSGTVEALPGTQGGTDCEGLEGLPGLIDGLPGLPGLIDGLSGSPNWMEKLLDVD